MTAEDFALNPATPAIAGSEIEYVSDAGENVCPDDGLTMSLCRKGPTNSPAVPAVNPGFVAASDAYPGCILHGPPAGNLPA